MRIKQILHEAELVSFTQLTSTQLSKEPTLSNEGDSDDTEIPSPEDLNRQGTIRVVKDAHLVYKRKEDANRYTELWIYKRNLLAKQSDTVYAAIMAATDIQNLAKKSVDGEQSVEVWSIGDPRDKLTFVKINGLSD
jgi:hypothetical protein